MLENVTGDQLLEKIKFVFDDSVTYDREWQTNAEEAFGFRDGWKQWTKEEKDILHEEMRPALTLNIVKSHIDLIKGLNEDIKKRYVATPVSVEDGFLCEVINNTVYWLYQKSDFESEEDNAYESALISGRGWVAMDYTIDERNMQDIKITMTSVPVHEVRMDPAARKRDLSDASYIFWDRWLSLEDFVIKYPKFETKARTAFASGEWPKNNFLDSLAPESGEWLNHDINDESDYSDALDVGYFDSKKKQIRVAHMEYWKYVKQYHVYDLNGGGLIPVKIPWKTYKERWTQLYPDRPLRYETTTTKEVWWIQFCGSEILYHGKSPIEYPGFSIIPCFLFGDVSRRRGYHYGVVELMKDPQREINKRSSQTLNLFNQQVQPGLYAEAKAFANVDQAEQSVKEAGSITWLQDGAITQQRFQERTVPTFPSAVLQMGEYAREMVRHITGINPDLLGMNDKRQEPGIVVQLRQQQGMSILKPVFKAYSVMREEIFKRLVAIVMTHMPTTQVLKILGEPERFIADKDGNIQDNVNNLSANIRFAQNSAYDIDVEPEPNSMTQNALELATFMEMTKNGIPVDPKVLIGKTNLPVTEKISWMAYLDNQQEAQSKAADHEMKMQMDESQRKYDIEMKKLELQGAIAGRKAEDQREKDILKGAIDQDKLDLQRERDNQTAQIKATQVMTQAQLGAQNAKQKWVEMMLDADHKKKQLILDTVEVMAQSRNAQTAESVKATLEMYKMALESKTMTKDREAEFAMAVMDAYTKMDIEKGKLALEKRKQDLDAKSAEESMASGEKTAKQKIDADLQKSKDGNATKLKSEKNKSDSTEKIAKGSVKSQEKLAKDQVKADKDTAAEANKNKPL